jgi:hypothetical protein
LAASNGSGEIETFAAKVAGQLAHIDLKVALYEEAITQLLTLKPYVQMALLTESSETIDGALGGEGDDLGGFGGHPQPELASITQTFNKLVGERNMPKTPAGARHKGFMARRTGK